MKKYSLSVFYFYISLIVGLCIPIQAHNSEIEHDIFQNTPESIQDEMSDVYTTLRIVRDLQDDIEESMQGGQQDIIIEIIVLCCEMYEKIVEVTVAHYLISNAYNLHNHIMKVVGIYVIKIVGVLCKRFVEFLMRNSMSWEEKVIHCVWVVSTIVLIKVALGNLPTTINPDSSLADSIGNISDKLAVPVDDKPFTPKPGYR